MVGGGLTLSRCRGALKGVGGRVGNMREAIQPFYSSRAWKNCRAEYVKSVGGLCERCRQRGIINAGSKKRPLEVHHKIRLTAANINDPRVTLNWDNLELLCKDCHDEEREKKNVVRRWRCGPDGRLMPPLVGER